MLSPTFRFSGIFYLGISLFMLFILNGKNTASAQGKNFSISRNEPTWIVKVENKNAQPKDNDI